MGINLENRLRKLEAKAMPGDDFKVFRVIGETEEELQAGIDRLIASGEALPTDHFFLSTDGEPAWRGLKRAAPDPGKSPGRDSPCEALSVFAWRLRFFRRSF
jgi:hypothetical protein